MLNIINIIIFIIINIIINKFDKKILLLLEKNHRFDLKGKINNFHHCCYSYYYYDC